MRRVFQEKELFTIARQAGCVRVYDREAYQKAHNGRTPDEDNIKAETVSLPDGQKKEAYKARTRLYGLVIAQTHTDADSDDMV